MGSVLVVLSEAVRASRVWDLLWHRMECGHDWRGGPDGVGAFHFVRRVAEAMDKARGTQGPEREEGSMPCMELCQRH